MIGVKNGVANSIKTGPEATRNTRSMGGRFMEDSVTFVEGSSRFRFSLVRGILGFIRVYSAWKVKQRESVSEVVQSSAQGLS